LIIGNPVHHGMTVAAKFIGCHVKRVFVGHELTSKKMGKS
jgi:hypothetical protein